MGMVTAGWLGCVLSNKLKFHLIGKLTGQLAENLCEHAISRNSIVMSLSHEGHVRKGVSDISLVVWGPFLKSPGNLKGLKPYFNINKLTQLYLYCSSITLPFLFSSQQIIGE